MAIGRLVCDENTVFATGQSNQPPQASSIESVKASNQLSAPASSM